MGVVTARLALEEVRFAYGPRAVLEDVSVAVEPGRLVALVGPNGAGKSTLLRVAAGLLVPQGGRVLLDGRPLAEVPRRLLARRVAGVASSEERESPFDVRESVALGRHPWRGRFAPLTAADRGKIDAALESTDLVPLADRPVARLSTGERQRVAIARALAQDADLLLLDEPTAHLDLGHGLRVLEVLRDLVRRGKTVLAALHDLSSAALAADRLVLMAAGRVVADGAPAEVLTPERIRDTFGAEVEVLGHPATGAPVVAPTLRPGGSA